MLFLMLSYLLMLVFLVFYCAVVNVTYADDVVVTFVDVVVVALMLLFKCS